MVLSESCALFQAELLFARTCPSGRKLFPRDLLNGSLRLSWARFSALAQCQRVFQRLKAPLRSWLPMKSAPSSFSVQGSVDHSLFSLLLLRLWAGSCLSLELALCS